MTDFVIRVTVDPTTAEPGIRSVEARLERVNRAATNTGNEIGGAFRRAGVQGAAALGLIDARAKALRTSLLGVQGTLQSALAFAGVAIGVRSLIQMSDAATSLRSRLRLVTTDAQNLAAVNTRLLQIANLTRQSYTATAETYTRIALQTRNLGLTQLDLLNVTENLNKAVLLSGATTIEATNALRQLTQGLASGTLRGEELTSVLEQLPLVGQLIAKEMGIAYGSLRNAAAQGQITSDIIIKSLTHSAEELGVAFAGVQATIGQAFTVLQNNLTFAIGAMNETTGGLNMVADAILWVANNLNIVIPLVLAFIAGLAVVKLVQIAQAMFLIVDAFRALSLVLIRNPVLLAIAVAGLVGFLSYKDEIGGFIDNMVSGFAGVPDAATEAFGSMNSAVTGSTLTVQQAMDSLLDTGSALGPTIQRSTSSGVAGMDRLTRSTNTASAAAQRLNAILAMHPNEVASTGFTNFNGTGGNGTKPGVTNGLNSSNMQMRASGGATQGRQPYVVGERGPEVIFPSYRGYVATAAQTRRMQGRASGGTIHPSLIPQTHPSLVSNKGLGSSSYGAASGHLPMVIPMPVASNSNKGGGDPSFQSVNFLELANAAKAGVIAAQSAQSQGIISNTVGASLIGFLQDIANLATKAMKGMALNALNKGFANAASRLVPDTTDYAEQIIGTVAWDRYIKNNLPLALATSIGVSSIFGGGSSGGGGGGGGFGGYATTASQLYANPNVYAGTFANGGSFRVPGHGGADNKLVSMMTRSGERISVNRNDNDNRERGNTYIDVQMVVNGVRDADSFRRSETQITAELAARIQRVQKDM